MLEIIPQALSRDEYRQDSTLGAESHESRYPLSEAALEGGQGDILPHGFSGLVRGRRDGKGEGCR